MNECRCRSHNGFLTALGLREAAQRKDCRPEVDAMEIPLYLDSRVSVSGLGRDETFHMCESLIEEQHRRFLNGS